MAKTVTLDEMVERARRAQEEQMAAIQAAAETARAVDETMARVAAERAEFERASARQIADVQAAHVKAYEAALTAGWTVARLDRIGLREPAKRRRSPRRQTHPRTAPQVREAVASSDTQATTQDL